MSRLKCYDLASVAQFTESETKGTLVRRQVFFNFRMI